MDRRGLPQLPSLELGALRKAIGSRLSGTPAEEFFLNENNGAGQTRFHVVLRTPNMEDLDALAGGSGIYIPRRSSGSLSGLGNGNLKTCCERKQEERPKEKFQ